MKMQIHDVTDLEERLSRPDDATTSAMAALDGDLLILGVGGKMGPSLARLARRAVEQAGVQKRIIAVARFTNNKLPSELESEGSQTTVCDLLEPGKPAQLPHVPNVNFRPARKFGT